MTDVKNVDLGDLQTHKNVLAEIVYDTVSKIGGVSFVKKPFTRWLWGQWTGQKYEGIDIKCRDLRDVSVSIQINVRYGLNIPQLAMAIQSAIKQALEETIDEIYLNKIDVNIVDVNRGDET